MNYANSRSSTNRYSKSIKCMVKFSFWLNFSPPVPPGRSGLDEDRRAGWVVDGRKFPQFCYSISLVARMQGHGKNISLAVTLTVSFD